MTVSRVWGQGLGVLGSEAFKRVPELRFELYGSRDVADCMLVSVEADISVRGMNGSRGAYGEHQRQS